MLVCLDTCVYLWYTVKKEGAIRTKTKSKFGTFIQEECSNWQKKEVAWLVVATLVIIGVSLAWGDSLLGIISSVSGVFCVILVGKGKISNHFFGIIGVTLYGFIAFDQGYYGDTMLNLAYYLPMNFVGYFLWSKNKNEDTGEVLKASLSRKNLGILAVGSVFAVGGYSMALRSLGGNLPVLDSVSTVFSVIAQLLCAFRLTEQWIFWIIVNVVSVVMWLDAFLAGSDSVATLLMWCVYLINAIFMWFSWNKETKSAELSAKN